MTDQEFYDLRQKVGNPSFLKIDDATAASMTSKLPNTYSTFLNALTKEVMVLKELLVRKEKMYGDLYVSIKKEKKHLVEGKHEFEAFINSNEDYNKLLLSISKQETIVMFLEKTLENIKATGYAVKNFIDIKRFYAGG